MKKDRLKDYINSERASFDSEEPRSDLWSSIESELDTLEEKQEDVSIWNWKLVAGIALLIGFSSMLATIWNSNAIDAPISDNNDPVIAPQEFVLAGISEDMGEVEMYYSSMVNDQKRRLADFDVDQEFLEELDYLQLEFESLKMEMGTGADDAKVVEALIENYRLRLALLEDLLNAFEKSSAKERRHETAM